MKRESSGDEGSSDHSDSFTPPYYAPQQPEEADFFCTHGAATPAKTTAIAQPMYAFQPIATSPNAMAIPPVVLPMSMLPSATVAVPTGANSTNGGGMDDMDHWLVDICAQLGGADDDATQTAGVRLPDAARCYDASSPPSSEFRPVYPATSMAAPMAFVPPLTASYVPYASSSSSPGSSSVESGSDTKPPSSVYSSADSSSTARPVRRVAATRAKRPVTTTAAAAASTAASSRVDPVAQPPAGSSARTSDASQPPLPPQLTPAETRREKNRLRVRRHYYRKLSQMNDLRAQVSELEEKIQSLQLENARGGSASALLLGNGGAPEQQQQQLVQLQSHLTQLESAKCALVAENQQVRELLYAQTQQLMLARQQQQQHRAVVRPDSSQLLGALMPPPFIVKRRLAPADCDRIWQSTMRGLRGLECCRALATAPRSSSRGDSICGWTATRAVEDGAFKFVFQKLLPGCTAAATLDAAWAIFRDPQRFAKLYSPSVNMWCALVQTVDDDNVVLYQEHKSMDKDQVHVVMKTVLLASRIKRADSGDFGITLRGVDHELLKLEDLSVSERDGYEVWNDVNCWLQWIPRGEHCEIKVSGAIPTVGSNAYFWMVEVLLIVMRLEAATASSANLFNVPP